MEITSGLYMDTYKRFITVYNKDEGFHQNMYLQNAALRSRGKASRHTVKPSLPDFLKSKASYLADRNLLNWRKAK